ncbi:hypothetical protein [Streptomyces sp. NPDC004658]|uniref:hypothetical protein n=1 Tax=Streptomyces sp. NPDC004658 TaxID=3154672 RepID=UPI0033A6BC82
MTDIIAGVEIPGIPAVAEATEFLRERTDPLIFHHSRREFLFGSLHADGADRARGFLLDRGFSESAADVVRTAIALHTTPGVPHRMGPETAATNHGVLTDAIGRGLDRPAGDHVEEIVVERVDDAPWPR